MMNSKIQEAIRYILVGIATTIINLLIYVFLAKYLKINILVANVIAWIGAVLFAYIANKKFVFRTHTHNKNDFIQFFMSRIFSGVVENLLFIMMLQYINSDIVIKYILVIVNVVLNYLMSKFIVFNEQK